MVEGSSMSQIQANQIGLQALFSILTICSLVFGYVRFSGWRSFVYALGPPILIAALLRSIFHRRSVAQDCSDDNAHSSVQKQVEGISLLLFLIVGLVIWIPLMIAIACFEGA